MATEVNVGRVQGAGFFSCSETLVEEGEEIQKGDIRTCYADKLLPKPFSELFDDSDTGYSLAVFVNDSVVDDGGHVFTVTAISGEYENNELVNYLLTLSYRDRFKGEKGDTGERGPEGYGIFDLNGKEVTNPSIYAATSAGESGSSLYGQGENVAPIWASPIITSLNGTKYDPTSTSSTGNKGIYAPTSAGSSGQYLRSNGSGDPSWASFTTTTYTLYKHKFLMTSSDYTMICEIIDTTAPSTTRTLKDALHTMYSTNSTSYCFATSDVITGQVINLFQFNDSVLNGTPPTTMKLFSVPLQTTGGYAGMLMIADASYADGGDDIKQYQAVLVIFSGSKNSSTPQMYYRTSIYDNLTYFFDNLESELKLTVLADFAEKNTL